MTIVLFILFLLSSGIDPPWDTMVCDTTSNQRLAIMNAAKTKLTSSNQFIAGRRGVFGAGKSSVSEANPTTVYGSAVFVSTPPTGYIKWLNTSLPNSTQWTTKYSLAETSYFVGRQDALVWLGCSPPEVRYFHIRTFAAVHTADPPHVPDAGLGDTINNANVNTSGGVDGSSPWNKTFLIISTADVNTFRLISEAFIEAGLPAQAINLDVLPSKYWIRFLDDSNMSKTNPEDNWYNAQADAISLIARFTGFRNDNDRAAYSGSVSQLMLFHRVGSSKDAHVEIAPTPEYIARPKGTGESEGLVLGEDLKRLRSNLITKMAQQGFYLLDNSMHMKDLRDDYRCIHYSDYGVFNGYTYGGFCDMQPQDVSFSSCEWIMPLFGPENTDHFMQQYYNFMFNDTDDPSQGSERVFVSIGVNHNRFKPVGFNSVMHSSWGGGDFESPANSTYFYDDDMNDSAAPFGLGLDFLYAVATAREKTCNSLSDLFPNKKHCQSKNKSEMPVHMTVAAIERVYLELATKTGPDIDELLPAEYFSFERPL